MTEPIRAAIYTRISSDPEGTRLGVTRQEEDCRRLCLQRGWAAAAVFEDDDLSAFSGKARPGYDQLLAEIRAGTVQAVVAWHPDRLHRHPRELEDFVDVLESTGATVATVQGGQYDLTTASGRMTARVVGAVARGESEHKSERQRRKHLELAMAGKDAGGGRPYGYEDDRLSVRESEAALVREAARRVLTGESMRAVCRDWNARRVPTVTGAPWSVQVLRRVLASARISGRREYRTKANGKHQDMGRILSDRAEWQAIISVEDSDRLRELFSDPNRRVNLAARRYLLTGGIARCGLCGKPLVARPRGDKRRSYVCASGPGFYGCGKIRILGDPLEELISEAVLLAVGAGALDEAMRERDDRESLEALLAVEAKLEELAQAWAADEITRGEWQAARKPLEARREALQRRVEDRRRSHDLEGLEGPLRERWPHLALRQQRAVIELLIEAVIVRPAVKGCNRFDPDRVEVRWRA